MLPVFQILLVDDSPEDARLFETALKEAAPRIKLYWVGTADEGMEYLNQEKRFQGTGPVSLVVCDLNLPRIDGLEFLSEVKKNPVYASVPFIVYTSSAYPSDIQRAYALGANSYIVKPMTLETMVSQLRSLVHYWLEVVALPPPMAPD